MLRAVLATAGVVVTLAAVPASVHSAAADPQRLCTETLVSMDDGVRLHAWVSRLAPDGPRPVLFMMDSYARGGVPGAAGPASNNACPQSLPDDYVPAYLSTDLIDRFTLVQVSERGTGSSEGVFDLTGPRTQRDITAAIDWAAAQPWSTGDVTLIGESGTAFYVPHGLHDPHVKAAVVYTSCPDMYRCLYRGGSNNGLADVYFGSTAAGYTAGLPARLRLGTANNPDPVTQLAGLADLSTTARNDTVDNAWWQQRSALDDLRDVHVPVLFTTDLYDIVAPFDAVQQIPNARLVLGMGHQSHDTVAAGGDRFTSLVRTPVDRFVAHYGLGDANGAQHDPRVTLVTNTGSVGQFRGGQLLVRPESSWPLAGTQWTPLYLDGSALTTAPAAGADSAAMDLIPPGDLRTSELQLGPLLGTDLRLAETAGLTYTTPVLTRDLEVSGPISLRLTASATASDFGWAVRLTDVWPDGRSEWNTDGYLRATLRRVDDARSLHDAAGQVVRPWLTYDTAQAVPADQPVQYQIDVIGTSNVFRAGHRLRLDVLPVGLGSVQVQRSSALLLPVIPDRCDRAAPLVPATPAVSCASSYQQAIGN